MQKLHTCIVYVTLLNKTYMFHARSLQFRKTFQGRSNERKLHNYLT